MNTDDRKTGNHPNNQYYKEHNPSSNRRARFHDYKKPGIYMITISKAPEAPDFSRLEGTEDSPIVIHSEAGRIIREQIQLISTHCPDIEVYDSVVMPDHIHMLLHAKNRLPKDLGHYIGLFKSGCTRYWRDSLEAAAPKPEAASPGASADTALSASARNNESRNNESRNNESRNNQARNNLPSLFAPKFNDLIAFNKEMTRRFRNYIRDNPRRRLIAMRYPELFSRVQLVNIADHLFDFYGNFQLLRHPRISVVIYSSKYTAAQMAALRQEWEETIRCRGVLISPFVHPIEKEVMENGITQGASIIRIIPDGLPPKYKPQGRAYALCAEGRLLHIGEHRASMRPHSTGRSVFLFLNAIARRIAADPALAMRIIAARRPSPRNP